MRWSCWKIFFDGGTKVRNHSTQRSTERSEVWGAVLSSTLTTVAVFLPIVFVQEEAGQLFRDIALAISAAVVFSLIISMTFIPMTSRRLLRTRGKAKSSGSTNRIARYEQDPSGNGSARESEAMTRNPEPDQGADTQVANPPPGRSGFWLLFPLAERASQRIVHWIESLGERAVNSIVGLNRWIQHGLTRRLALTSLLILTAIGLSWALWPKVEYLPTGNRNLVFGILLPPPGYNLDQMMAMGEQVETALRPYWDVEPNSPEAEQLDFPAIADFFFVARGRQIFMGLRAHDPSEVSGLIPLVQKVGAQLPGTFTVAKQSSLFEQGLVAGRTIDVEITGPELTRLVALGGQILGKTKQIFPTAQVRPVPSLDLSSPELHIKPQLMQTAEMGVSSTDLGYTVDALVDGAYATDYFLDGDKIDLTIKGETTPRQELSGHSGIADRNANRRTRAAGGTGRRQLEQRSGAGQSSGTPASDHDRGFPAAGCGARRCDGPDPTGGGSADARCWSNSSGLPNRFGRHGRQAPRHVGCTQLQCVARLADYLPVDGGSL